MKTFKLEGKSREIIARSADQKRALKAMRKNDEIPAVLYGGEKVVHFAVTNDAVRKLVYTPEIFAVELTIDGETTMAILKEIQFHPVSDKILHMDFLAVSKEKAVEMEVPVALEGHAEGVKAGGKLTLQMRKLRVKAIYDQIPEKLVINVDNLGLGKTMQVGALHFEGLEIMNAKNAVVCAVQLTRAARGAQAKA
ncbi:MAG: 50S ribosomal protein L25/general stress protein Ctc [Parabacteroides sp.]|nr:50S ribosomal protein L25/general stress protein Ctc [Parabacteroides sp.]MCI7783588.1 50S ribosomal protein L25/general stress protein Ctc [Parabacteroides sp.]MDD6080444.1 50S ribosomal protein L25/general stress protein Ctc [bacterium]MDD7063364.1 50S ribosomal protein L25/general stress protein Ctc [bacterium]MDY4756225.1 50S ribosomal protein L25/general stress protein Ctc [Parabacteroides sp.]